MKFINKFLFFLGVLIVSNIFFLDNFTFAITKINQVVWTANEDNYQLVIKSPKVISYTSNTVKNPFRIIIDINNSFVVPTAKAYPFRDDYIKRVKVNQFNNNTVRAVITLSAVLNYTLSLSNDKTVLTLSINKPKTSNVLSSTPVNIKPILSTHLPNQIKNITLKKLAAGIEVKVNAKEQLNYNVQENTTEKKLNIEFKDSTLNWEFNKVLVNNENLKSIETDTKENKVVLSFNFNKKANYKITTSPDKKDLEVLILAQNTTNTTTTSATENTTIQPTTITTETTNTALTPEVKTTTETPLVSPTLDELLVEDKGENVEITLTSNSTIVFQSSQLESPDRIKLFLPGFKIGKINPTQQIDKAPIVKIYAVEEKEADTEGTAIYIELSKKIGIEEAPANFSEDRKKISLTFKKETSTTTEPTTTTTETTTTSTTSEVKIVKTNETVSPTLNELLVEDQGENLNIVLVSDYMLNFQSSILEFPDRVKLFLPNAKLGKVNDLIMVNKPPVVRVTAVQSTEGLEIGVIIFIQVTKPVTLKEVSPTFSEDMKKLTLTFKKETPTKKTTTITTIPKTTTTTTEETTTTDKTKITPTTTVPKTTTTTPPPTYNKITSLKITKLPGKAQLTLYSTDEIKYKVKDSLYPPKIIVEVFNSVLSSGSKDISLNHGSISNVRIYQYQVQPISIVRVVFDLAQKVDYKSFLQAGNKELVLDVDAPALPTTKKTTMIAQTKKTKKQKQTPSIPTPKQTPVYKSTVPSKVVNMEFKEAEVVDILRILAEMSNMNIVTPETNLGTLTITLNNVSLEKALDLVINTAGLAWRIYGNTLIVAKDWDVVNKIGSTGLVGDYQVATFSIPGYTKDEFAKILEKAVPEANIVEQNANRPVDTITIVGTPNTLMRVQNLINSMKPTPEVEAESFELGNIDPDDVETALNTAIPQATVISKKKSPNLITISGSKYTMDKAKKFLLRMKLKPTINYTTLTVRYTNIEEIESLLEKVLPGVKLVRSQVGSDTSSLTLAGTDEDLTKAAELITSLEGGDNNSNLAKSVKVFKLKNIDVIDDLKEQTGFDIKELLTSTVPGLSSDDITIDSRTNSIIVRAVPMYFDKVEEMLTALDQKLPQVVIEVQVLDMSENDFKTFSSSFSEIAETPGEDLRTTNPPGINASTSGDTAGNVGINFNALKAAYNLAINNLITSGNARVLASPKVATISGKKATITLTDNIPYCEETQSTTGTVGATTIVTRTFKTQSVGITLEITPRVNEDKTITLNLKPKVETLLTAPTQTCSPPATNSREVETLLRIEDGKSIIIGGLINSTEQESMSKIPFLSNLPIVGKLFKSSKKESSDSQVVIIVTARIVQEE